MKTFNMKGFMWKPGDRSAGNETFDVNVLAESLDDAKAQVRVMFPGYEFNFYLQPSEVLAREQALNEQRKAYTEANPKRFPWGWVIFWLHVVAFVLLAVNGKHSGGGDPWSDGPWRI